tara:strand:+ start:2508 stop:3116 length:609 start_codon:yes stop_codon:yes gene_type:complete
MPAASANSNPTPIPKRDEILQIASRLFYEQGFGATGIKQIIDEAGIAKGTFYSHFQSKEQLGVAWLRARHATWNGWFEEAIRNRKSAGKKLLATFDFLESWLADCNYRGCAFLNTMAETPDFDSPMREEVTAHKNQLHERFQKLALEHFADQEPEASARQLGSVLFLLFEGALVETQNFHDTWPVEVARVQAKKLIEQESAS